MTNNEIMAEAGLSCLIDAILNPQHDYRKDLTLLEDARNALPNLQRPNDEQ